MSRWQRLIRFVAAETGNIHFGQPCDAAVDVGLAVHRGQRLTAFEITGDVLTPNARVSDKVLTVRRLLTPLSREQIGLVRCLGLNFSDHAAEARSGHVFAAG